MNPVSLIAVCVVLAGCSALERATASRQWIEYPDASTNIAPETSICFSNNAMPRELRARERLLVGEPLSMDEVVRLWAIGEINCSGPAKIKRDMKYNPKTGEVSFSAETDNASWVSSLFQGMWSTLTGTADWLAKVASGAKP